MTLPDQIDRLTAKTDLDRNIVVLAGAGTGKTTILIDRLALLILGKGIPIERIVALTFTKKAAEEMRVRLEAKLRSFGDDAEFFALLDDLFPESKSERLVRSERALHNLPKSQIGTIHSFAGHLLRLYPLQAGVDPNFREDDGTESDLLFEREWDTWGRAEFSGASSRSAAWDEILKRVSFLDIKEFAGELKSPFIEKDALIQRAPLRSWARDRKAECDRFTETIGRPERPADIDRTLDQMAGALESVANGRPLEDGFRRDWLKRSKPAATKVWKSHPALYDRFLDIWADVKLLCQVDDETVARLVSQLEPFIARLRQEQRRLGLVSFDDLLIKTRNLLRNHPAVRRALKRQFHTFLIDEFQDTDPLQGEILFYLAEREGEENPDWRGVSLEAGRLFVVGDPQQSIYKFRGADIAAFSKVRETMIRQGARAVVLSSNFRSRPGILNEVNNLFAPLLVEEGKVQPAFVPLHAVREQGGSSVEWLAVESPPASPPPGADDVRDFEAEWMGDWIVREVEKKKAVRYRDIAVLLRSTPPFSHYLESLRRKGIPYVAEGEKYFYRTPEVVDFVNLASIVANPSDSLSLVGVLRSPVGALTDREIWDLKKGDGFDYRTEPPVHRDKIGWLYAVLRDLSQKAVQRPVGKLIREIMDRTWLLELTSKGSHGEQAVSNLLKIQRLAETWSETEPLDLGTFVRRFQQYRDDEKEEGENPLSDHQYDAVRVSTIHKAKGLEFPVVILPNLFAERPRGAGRSPVMIRDWESGRCGLRLKKSKIANSSRIFLERESERKEEAEEKRVFYVASTRARDRMVSFVWESNRSAPSFIDLMKSANAFPEPTERRIWQPVHPRESARLTEFGTVKSETPAALAAGVTARKKSVLEAFQRRLLISPSLLINEKASSRTREAEKGPRPNDDGSVRRDHAQQLGQVCHKVLETWDFGGRLDLNALLQRAAFALELNFEIDADRSLIDEARAILNSFFRSPSYDRLRKGTILGREIPFVFPGRRTDPFHPDAVRGVIDVLYRDKKGLVVADYKTNKLNGGKKALLDLYRMQGDIYKEAVRRTFDETPRFELIFLRTGETVPC